MKYLLCLFLFLLSGCAKNLSENNEKTTPLDKKIYSTVECCKIGKATSPIVLSYRKLSVSEIAEHLDMDEETARLHLKATNIHGYFSIDANNVPPSGEFTLYHVNYTGDITPTKTYFVNGNQKLVTKLDNIYVDLPNNYLFFSNYLPGEPASFVLASADKRYFSALRIIPNPVEIIDEQNHRLSLEIASPDKRRYTVQCSGLKPFGSYLLVTRFENEKFANPLEADSQGRFFFSTGPNTPWINGGDGSLEMRGDGITTPLYLEFQWGG